MSGETARFMSFMKYVMKNCHDIDTIHVYLAKERSIKFERSNFYDDYFRKLEQYGDILWKVIDNCMHLDKVVANVYHQHISCDTIIINKKNKYKIKRFMSYSRNTKMKKHAYVKSILIEKGLFHEISDGIAKQYIDDWEERENKRLSDYISFFVT